MNARQQLLAPSRWRWWEVALWLAIWATPLLLGSHAAQRLATGGARCGRRGLNC